MILRAAAFFISLFFAASAQATCGFGVQVGVNCVGYLTATGTHTFADPGDWTTPNEVDCIGGGGGGSGNDTLLNNAAGAGSGAFAKATNITPTFPATYAVGAAGVGGSPGSGLGQYAGTDGGDTWFNGSSVSNASCGAQSVNTAGIANVNGKKGVVASGSGFSGADGGGTSAFGGSGAGAAGPNGAGGVGGGTGAAGGAADGGTVAGGSAGGGAGQNGTEFDSTHGSGSGGGGVTFASGLNGGVGGCYGGGGAGGLHGGNGCQGIIRIVYRCTVACAGAVPKVWIDE